MPLKTIALVAAASAAAGAAASSVYFSTRRDQQSTTPTRDASQTPFPTSSAPKPLPARPPIQQQQQQPQRPQQYAAPISPVDPSGLFQYGFPGPTADLLPAPALISSFDRRNRNPHWVAEHITPESLENGHADRRYSQFVEDENIPPLFRAKLSDYFRSGYDRGHQVPAADAKWSQAAMDSTFSLSNMCPQVGVGFNRDYWAHFEDFCRRLTQSYPSVRIVTGPLYLPRRDPDGKWRVTYEVIGSPPNVSVPTHFYKVILAEDGQTGGKVSLGAFVLPNAEIDNEKPLRDFEVPLEIVERASGLEFASKLAPERRRRLCQEVECSLIVRDYAKRQEAFGRQNRK